MMRLGHNSQLDIELFLDDSSELEDEMGEVESLYVPLSVHV